MYHSKPRHPLPNLVPRRPKINGEMAAATRRTFLIAGPAASVAAWGQDKPLADKLPSGRSRDLELIKRDHEKALEDMARLRKLAREVEETFTADTEYVVNVNALAKLEEIEDLAKSVRKRMQRRY